MQPPPDTNGLAGQYAHDRRTLRYIAAGVAVFLMFLGALAFAWVATRPVELDDPTTGAVTEVDLLRVQVEELSRSQDRFQQAIAGVATVAGAGLVALVGFNFIASSRNVDRESTHLRQHAEYTVNQVRSAAADQFEQSLAEVIGRARKRMEDLHNEALTRLDDAVSPVSESVIAEVEREISTGRDELNSIAAGAANNLAAQAKAYEQQHSQAVAETRGQLIDVLKVNCWALNVLVEEHKAKGYATDHLYLQMAVSGAKLMQLALEQDDRRIKKEAFAEGLVHLHMALENHSTTGENTFFLNRRLNAIHEIVSSVPSELREGPHYPAVVAQLDARRATLPPGHKGVKAL